jgi:hypothetical protein
VAAVDTQGRAGFAQAISFSSTAPSQLMGSVEWTLSSNSLEVVLFQGPCSPDAFYAIPSRCTSVGGVVASGTKPRRIAMSALPMGTYSLGIANRGTTAEAYTFEVTVTQ